MEAAQFGDALPQFDVRPAARHVGGDRDLPPLAGLGNDLRFALVVLGVQNVVLDSGPGQVFAQQLRLLDGDGPDQHGPARPVEFLDLLDRRIELLLLGLVDDVRMVGPDHGHVGRNDQDVQIVDLLEFGRLGVGGARHARQFFVHAEIVLEGNGGQGLVLPLDFHLLLRLQGLVQTVAVAPARHDPAGEFVDDDHFAFLDDIIHVPLEQGMGLQGLVDMMQQFHVPRLVEILHFEIGFDPRHALLGQHDGPALLVNRVILFFPEPGYDLVDAVVLVRRLVGRARDDQGRPGLIDEDAVHLVDDGIVKIALDVIREAELHVVPQIVESELVVGTVGDVRMIGFPPLVVIQAVHDDAHGHSQHFVDGPHPCCVPLGQIIVHRDQVDALSGQGIQIERHGCRQRFPLTGLHFRDRSLVQDQPAENLNVERPHPDAPPGRLADDREGFHQDVLQAGSLRQFFSEVVRFGAQSLVAEASNRRFQIVDLPQDERQALHLAVVFASDHFLQQSSDHK